MSESDRIAAPVLLAVVERSRRRGAVSPSWSGLAVVERSRRVEAFLERARQAVRDQPKERVGPADAFRSDELDDLP